MSTYVLIFQFSIFILPLHAPTPHPSPSPLLPTFKMLSVLLPGWNHLLISYPIPLTPVQDISPLLVQQILQKQFQPQICHQVLQDYQVVQQQLADVLPGELDHQAERKSESTNYIIFHSNHREQQCSKSNVKSKTGHPNYLLVLAI